MIVEKLISDISKNVNMNRETLSIAIRLCEAKGVLTKQEAMQMDNAGFPIFSIIKNVLSVDSYQMTLLIDRREITYSDVICMIGIVAQDEKIQYQNRVMNRYYRY